MANRVKIDSHININLDRIYKGLGDEFKKSVANELWKRAGEYVPMDTGNLQDTVNITPEYVEYEVPYAHYQWAGKNLVTGGKLNYSTEKHAKATDHWDQVFMDMHRDEFMAEVEKLAWKALGGG